jgi:hypothetical protein
MNRFDFILTDDGSVGLFDEEVKDIYHSRTGALKEAFDKFIFPTDFKDFCSNNPSVRILDICYGIGYNSKSAIYSAIQVNKNIKIHIDALEISKEISFISPFINDCISDKYIDLYLLAYFLHNHKNFAEYICSILGTLKSKFTQYFDADICLVFENYNNSSYLYNKVDDLVAFLHNIYYQNISTSMENSSYPPNDVQIDFNLYLGDARDTLKNLDGDYDFVFLDAFTPHKQPLLWTFEFLNLIKSKMNNSGIFSTYSNSTPVRKSLLDLGFNLGKIILDNQQFGTIATLKSDFINNPLSLFDQGLMKTKAGIPYRDKNLSLSSQQILKNREIELKSCDIISATEFKRIFSNDL